MKKLTLRHILIAALLAPVAAIAQVAGVSEAQLDKGFLGEQNVRNTYPGAPTDSHYLMRASGLISSRQYEKALAVLRLNRATATHFDSLLAGRAYLGLGDNAAARKSYQTAIRKRKNFTTAYVELGELEARFGDQAAAEKLVADLSTSKTACAGECSNSTEALAGIGRIRAAMAARQ